VLAQADARMQAKHVAVTLKKATFACLLLLTDKNQKLIK
jgi:hypothetical protein